MAKIPKLKTDQEVREFWDTHSLADYEEDLRPAGITFAKPRKEVVTIRLERPLILALKKLAQHSGIGYSSLARMWVIEKLRQTNKEVLQSLQK